MAMSVVALSSLFSDFTSTTQSLPLRTLITATATPTPDISGSGQYSDLSGSGQNSDFSGSDQIPDDDGSGEFLVPTKSCLP